MEPSNNVHDSGASDHSTVAFASYVRALLAGQAPNGAPPEAFGDYRDLIETLLTAHASGSTPAVRAAWRGIIRRHPELAELVAGDPEEAQRRTRWTADELLAAQFPPIRWIVPDIFPEGLTFLAGRPKIGKSLLALQLAHAVSSGGTIFSQEVVKAPVLYLAFEDSARRLQRRMKEQIWLTHTNATFYTAWDPLDQGGLVTLQQAMIEEGYRLVVIDTLSRAISGKSDQNSVSDMTMVLSTLQRLALDRQASIQLIDHHHKAQGVHPDPVDDILGSTGKGAVADCVAGLYRERGKKGAILHIVGRDLDGDKRLALEWDKQLSGWKYLGDADEVTKNALQTGILTALEQLGQATTTQLADFLDENKGSISRELNDLFNRNKVIVLEKRGREIPYALPGQGKTQEEREC